MSSREALVYAYLLDGKGNGKVVDWNAIDDWNLSQGLLWIHLYSKIDETRVWLENDSRLSQIADLRRKAVILRRYIAPQRDVLFD
jgi:hypothetical protein